jgi:hypothetical protein
MIIAICALVGLVGGFIAGCCDDGPVMGLGGAFVGSIVGLILGLILTGIFNPSAFA